MGHDEYRDGSPVSQTDEKAIKQVKKDFDRAEKYLDKFHKQCIDRYAHYIAPGMDSNPDKDKYFPVPFITEQVDTFVAESMEKIWHKDEPCSMFGRNLSDKSDADAKREFMKYQDDVDGLHFKTRQALLHASICRIAPAVVNYKEEFDVVEELQDVPVLDGFGNMVLGLDGQTPIMTQQFVEVKKYTYQGATVELIDPIDFFWTQEKREIYDDQPFMIRSRRSMEWFKSKPYIIQKNLKKLTNEKEVVVDTEIQKDLLDERRTGLGMGKQEEGYENLYQYVEWHGYIDLDGEGKRLCIIGIAGDDVLVRLEKARDIFDLGHPNIVIGVIGREFGEIFGLSLVDKIHSSAHAQDSLMGMLFKNLRQVVNNMWIGDSSKMRTKKLVNDAGVFIDVMAGVNIDSVLKRVEPAVISRDLYEGLSLFRKMGQNASGISDIASGVAQQGVETLGEANILAGQAATRTKGGYLRSFEKSFIEPLWQMRNKINNRFCTDVGYMYMVLEDNFMHWRTLEPHQIKAEVDFVCEASARDTERSVVTQQILQAVNMNIKMIDVLGPQPLVLLLKKLYEEGFGWKKSDIDALLPQQAIAEQKQIMEQQRQAEMTGENPSRMPQPLNASDAIKSASTANQPQVGRVGDA